MSQRCSCCCVTFVNGKVYVVGGYSDYTRLASCEMFGPATNEWSAIPSMNEAPSFCAACAIGDKLHVIGGYNGDGWLSSDEVYDTITQE